MYIFIAWLVWNLIVFALFGVDKQLAVLGRQRIPERVLILTSFLGGGTGALAGMFGFRHKTRKLLFQIGTPIAAVASVALLISLLIV